jgi:hypothetical protein
VDERRLSATYLQRVIAAVLEHGNAPTEIRNECHRLMMAIGTNNRAEIAESVSRVEQLAERAGVKLPAPDSD